MDTTCPIYVSAIDKKTGKAFVKQVDVPYRRTLEIENYFNYCSDIEYVEWSYDYESILNTVRAMNESANYSGKILKCKQCGKYYYMTLSNIAWYKEKGLDTPKRCMACRKKNREKNYLFS